MCVNNSLNRLGAFVPVDGYRKIPLDSVFVDPSDQLFDELWNFSCSQVGELASNIKSQIKVGKESLDKNILFFDLRVCLVHLLKGSE